MEGHGSQDRDIQRCLYDEIEELPSQQRLAFSLTTLDNMNYDETGKILGCSPATVRKHCQLARKELKKVAEREKAEP